MKGCKEGRYMYIKVRMAGGGNEGKNVRKEGRKG
jgi:hypothetical protein